MMHLSLLLSLPLLSNALVISPIVDDTIPLGVTLRNFTFGGSGCPSESSYSYFYEKEQKIVLEFEEMYAQSGRMVETNGTSRYCSLNVELDYPSLEWSFAVQTVEYFGYISIPTNVNATLSSSTYFGPTAKSTAFVEFVGPMKKLFENSASFGEDLVWSECGETAQAAGIQTGIEIKGDGKKDALVTVDFDSGRMRQLYAIQWRRCVL